MKSTDKAVLIAGGTGGLGQEVSLLLGKEGYTLRLIERESDKKSEKLKARLKQENVGFTFYRCDFTKSDEINDAIEIFFEEEKEPYALVNLIGDPARYDWKQAQIHHMQDSFLKNASAPLHSAKQFALKLQSLSRPGAIVLFSSMQGVYPFENSLYYGTAKAALAHGAKILAKDFGGRPLIRINVIAPGVNRAGMAEESIARGKYQAYIDKKIIPHYGEPSSVAKTVLFLLDPDLYMTGQTLLYDGGLSLRRDLLRE